MDLTMEGYSIGVNEAQVMDYQDFLGKYQGEDEYSYPPEKIYDVSVTLKNLGADDTTGINMMDFYISGLAVCADLNIDMYDLANPQLSGQYAIALRKNSELEIHLPFSLWEADYHRKTWNKLEEFEMNLVTTLYPVKQVISLNK